MIEKIEILNKEGQAVLRIHFKDIKVDKPIDLARFNFSKAEVHDAQMYIEGKQKK